jgi:hypothetical protein
MSPSSLFELHGSIKNRIKTVVTSLFLCCKTFIRSNAIYGNHGFTHMVTIVQVHIQKIIFIPLIHFIRSRLKYQKSNACTAVAYTVKCANVNHCISF